MPSGRQAFLFFLSRGYLRRHNDYVHRARDSILMVIAKPDARAPAQQLLSGPLPSGMTPRERTNDFRSDAGRVAFGDDGA